MDTAPTKLINRLTHVMLFMLLKGADPGISNLAGDVAPTVGNALTQTALRMALAAASGEITLETETLEDYSAASETPDKAQGAAQAHSQDVGDSGPHAAESVPHESFEQGPQDGPASAHEVLGDQGPPDEAEEDMPQQDGPNGAISSDAPPPPDEEGGSCGEATPDGRDRALVEPAGAEMERTDVPPVVVNGDSSEHTPVAGEGQADPAAGEVAAAPVDGDAVELGAEAAAEA
jgi:hypothetical protein